MTHAVLVGDATVNVDLVVFDKDGTLIDFTDLWHGAATAATANLLKASGLNPCSSAQIYAALGFNPDDASTDADGALAVGPNARIYRLVEEQLQALGQTADTARGLVADAFIPVLEAPPTTSMLRKTGDVAGVFSALKAQGIKVAVATTDLRSPTITTLKHLGVLELIDDLLCADDPVRRTKPDPKALTNLARDNNVNPNRVMMVGDTVGDMRMTRLTHACTGVAVLTGAGTAEELSEWSDIVIDGIDQIRPNPLE